MNILALETSSRAASCALLRDGVLAGEFFANIGLTHSQTAMPMLERLLERTGMTPGDIDVFAASAGPGSFTGLRIGISAVKGMAFTTGKPCAGVPTLLGLAYNAELFSGYVVPVMDARRGQVYTALFKSGEDGISRVTGDAALSIEELGQILAPLAPVPVLLVGDGAMICEAALPEYVHIRRAPERFLHQRASSVAVAALKMAEAGELAGAGELEPVYLRLPQAERERLARERDAAPDGTNQAE